MPIGSPNQHVHIRRSLLGISDVRAHQFTKSKAYDDECIAGNGCAIVHNAIIWYTALFCQLHCDTSLRFMGLING